jgi:hypothetical protein
MNKIKMVDAPGLIHLIVFCVVNKNKKINKHNIFFINQNYTGYFTSDNELSGIEKKCNPQYIYNANVGILNIVLF